MTPFVADPATLVVRTGAGELTGAAVTVDDTTAAGSIPIGSQETSN
jgi:hypothetical protein